MRLTFDKKRLAPFWFSQPTMVSSGRVWLTAALGCVFLPAWILQLDRLHHVLRVSAPVFVAVIVVVVVVAALIFLRYQHAAFALMQRPGFWPRFAGSIFRVACGSGPIAIAFSLQTASTLAMQAPMLIMITLATIGGSIMYAGSVRRVGDEQVCAACGTPVTTSTSTSSST